MKSWNSLRSTPCCSAVRAGSSPRAAGLAAGARGAAWLVMVGDWTLGSWIVGVVVGAALGAEVGAPRVPRPPAPPLSWAAAPTLNARAMPQAAARRKEADIGVTSHRAKKNRTASQAATGNVLVVFLWTRGAIIGERARVA